MDLLPCPLLLREGGSDGFRVTRATLNVTPPAPTPPVPVRNGCRDGRVVAGNALWPGELSECSRSEGGECEDNMLVARRNRAPAALTGIFMVLSKGVVRRGVRGFP